MKFIKFYSAAFFKMKIFCKFTSFLNFLFLEAAAAAMRRYRHRGSGSAVMDISALSSSNSFFTRDSSYTYISSQ
jgi:hypothetical protein